MNQIDAFLATLIGKSRHTRDLYRFVLEKFWLFCGKDPSLITIKDAQLYLANCEEKLHYAPASLKIHAIVLRLFLRYLHPEDWEKIRSQIKPPKPGHTKPVFASMKEIQRMEEAAMANPRDRLIIRILFACGIRVSELCGDEEAGIPPLLIENIDWDNRIVKVLGKGQKERFVLLDQMTVALVDQYRERRTEGPLVTLSTRQVQRLVKAYAVKAGLRLAKLFHPHSLRHSFAIDWIRKGGDIESLRRILGHESLDTTKLYLDFGMDQVKAAYDKIHRKTHK